MQKFIKELSKEVLALLKKELLDVAKHYKIEVLELARNAELKRLVVEYLNEEDFMTAILRLLMRG